MANLVVYGNPVSPFVRKVEVGPRPARHGLRTRRINNMAMPDWFLEISPARRIPVLRDRTVGEDGPLGTIADSSAICAYLDRKLEAGLYGESAFDTGRIVWLEEYADTELAQPTGMQLFRPIVFPRIAGQESDIETARTTWNETLPRRFDYLEGVLDGNAYFVGGELSIADIAVGAQMTQLDLVAGTPDESRWPALVRHTRTMREHTGFARNLAACREGLARLLPEKVDLS